MHADEAFLRRFLLAAPAMPPDVAAWAKSMLLDSLPPARRIVERDRLLRAAAALLPAAPPWTKARQLHDVALAVSRALPADPDLTTSRGCVAAALLLRPGKEVPTVRHLYRVLLATAADPLEMSEAQVRCCNHGRAQQR